MKIRNSDELFDDLVNLNADEWNMKLATELNMSLDELRSQFVLRDKITNISEDRIKLHIYKNNVINKGNKNIQTDQESFDKLSVPNVSPDEKQEVLHKPTTLDRYSIRVREGQQIIESISVTGKILVGIDLSDAELDFSYFCHCVFYNCDFSNSNLSESVFQSCVFNSCSFNKSDLSNATFSKAMFLDCNCDNSSLHSSKFILSSIISCQFNLSKLQSTYFSDTGLVDCDMMNCDLSSSEFCCSSITNCNLRDSDMQNSKITDMLCSRNDFRGCNLNHTTISCLTATSCHIDPKYDKLFQMNHLIFSPAIVEWEKNPDKEPPSEDKNENSNDEDPFL